MGFCCCCFYLVLLILYIFLPLFSSALRALMGSSPSFSTSSHSTPVAEKLRSRAILNNSNISVDSSLSLSLPLLARSYLFYSACFIQTGFLCICCCFCRCFFRIIARMEFQKITRYAANSRVGLFPFHFFFFFFFWCSQRICFFLSMRKKGRRPSASKSTSTGSSPLYISRPNPRLRARLRLLQAHNWIEIARCCESVKTL